METGGLIFITGGARSGKSSFAERYAISRTKANSTSLQYIATSRRTDGEMMDRIKRHQSQREKSDVTWNTWEQPVDLDTLRSEFNRSDTVLLDCLTILLSNELFRYEERERRYDNQQYQKQLYGSILNAIISLSYQVDTLIVVSNDVLMEPISEDIGVKSYARLLGNLHQNIVKHAAKAYSVESGIARLMKEVSSK